MKQSQLFPSPIKGGKKYDSANATYLINGGFIDQVMAGVYTFLPLGWRVLSKIERIIKKEMDAIGQDMLMPGLAPKKFWEDTGRLEQIDVLFKASGANASSIAKNDAEYILNCTQEDVITPLAKRFATSYKQFPFALYHIQVKYRNEPRAKSGILRGREFRMKDLYSFHTSEEDLLKYYEQVAKPAYIETFRKLGLGDSTVIALASGGDFTDKFSHEFQTMCDAGEDTLFYDEVDRIYYNREVAPAQAPPLQHDEHLLTYEEVIGEGIVGVSQLAAFLKIPVEKTTKTMLFENEKKQVIAAAVAGGYEVDLGKLKKVSQSTTLQLATPETVKRITNAEVGYAGTIGLPPEVAIYYDNSCAGRINFEMGANKTNIHAINVNFGRDIPAPKEFYDIKVTKDTDLNPKTLKPYKVFKSAEVGNIFPLNTKFSKALNYTYKDEQGKEHLVYMGSYGIGTTRVMGVLVEKHHDERGICWPIQVAPFHVHLISLDAKEQEIAKRAEEIYQRLLSEGIEVLYDDRVEVSAGAKFSDADLIGIPVRIVVSKRTHDTVEMKLRTEKQAQMCSLQEAIVQIKNLVSKHR